MQDIPTTRKSRASVLCKYESRQTRHRCLHAQYSSYLRYLPCYIYTSTSVPCSCMPRGEGTMRVVVAGASSSSTAATATANAERRHQGTTVVHLSVSAHSLSGSLGAWQNVTFSPAAHKVRPSLLLLIHTLQLCLPFSPSTLHSSPNTQLAPSLNNTSPHFILHLDASVSLDSLSPHRA